MKLKEHEKIISNFEIQNGDDVGDFILFFLFFELEFGWFILQQFYKLPKLFSAYMILQRIRFTKRSIVCVQNKPVLILEYKGIILNVNGAFHTLLSLSVVP